MSDVEEDGAESAPESVPESAPESAKGERIARRLARAGLCSRREAERWVEAGRVTVDGAVLTSPAVNVDESSLILVDGKPLPDAERVRLWRHYKPRGLVTSHRDPEGRPTVFDNLPEGMPRVISVGRLDLTAEGLLLLTNDGALARRLELPATGWARRYRVRVHGSPDPAALAALEKGVTVAGVHYGPIKAVFDRAQGSNAWLTLSLREGKNREVRRVLEHLGCVVTRLIRIAYGPFQLGLLADGQVEEVPARVMREQLGTAGPGKVQKSKGTPHPNPLPQGEREHGTKAPSPLGGEGYKKGGGDAHKKSGDGHRSPARRRDRS